MEVFRARIRGWTASFRYPIFVVGLQPTLPVPPLSTVYGLLSASKGELVTPENTGLGYVFHSKGKFIDLETVYELGEGLTAKSNICRREVLAEPEMYLYVTNREYKKYLLKPHYPVVMGRSGDLCIIDSVKPVELKKVENKIKVGKSIIPFKVPKIHGLLQSLPMYLTGDIPRRAVGTQMYYLLDNFIEYSGSDFYYDEEMDWGVYIHGDEAYIC